MAMPVLKKYNAFKEKYGAYLLILVNAQQELFGTVPFAKGLFHVLMEKLPMMQANAFVLNIKYGMANFVKLSNAEEANFGMDRPVFASLVSISMEHSVSGALMVNIGTH